MKLKYKIVDVVLIILLMWLCAAGYQLTQYEEDVYDCSNMVVDQERFFNRIGISTKVAAVYGTELECGHVWILLPFNIPFECEVLLINPFAPEPDDVFESVAELVSLHPVYADDFT